MGQLHPEDRVARLEQRHVDGVVGLGAGVRLDVGVLGAEQLLGAVDRELLGRRRPTRSRRSSACPGRPSAYLLVSTEPAASRIARGTKFSEAIISSVPCWRSSSRLERRRRSRDRPRRAARSGSGRAARSSEATIPAAGIAWRVRPARRSLAALLLGHRRRRVRAAPRPPTPAKGPEAAASARPDLRIGRPPNSTSEHAGGRVRLRATSDVRSRGKGPMELRGHRDGWRSMRVNQRIHRSGGGRLVLRTRASLHFTDVGSTSAAATGGCTSSPTSSCRADAPRGQCRARWSHQPEAQLLPARPRAHSPRAAARRASRHYPGCDQNPYPTAVTLGTSVGWSDIYPATTTSSGSTSPACAAASPSS